MVNDRIPITAGVFVPRLTVGRFTVADPLSEEERNLLRRIRRLRV